MAAWLIITVGLSYGQYVSVKTTKESVFTAIRNGKNIGWLKASILQNGNETYLTTESKLVVDVLISFTAIAKSLNKYTGTVLTEASVHRTLNGKIKLDNEIRLVNGRYRVSGSDKTGQVNRAIRHSVTFLYFNEPTGISEVFSEVYLCFLVVTKTGESTYTTLLPDGGSMTYTYHMGQPTNIIAKTSYGTIQFKLVK